MTSAGDILRVTFTADRAALIALLQHEARISRTYQIIRRRNIWHAAVWGGVLAAACGFFGYVRAAAPEVAPVRGFQGALTFAVLWAVFAAAVLSPRGFYRLVDSMIQRRFDRSAPDVEYGPFVVTLVEEGIVCDSAQSSKLALWSEVEKMAIEEDAVYIDLVSGSVFRIPREAFRTDVAYRRFIEFACARISCVRSECG